MLYFDYHKRSCFSSHFAHLILVSEKELSSSPHFVLGCPLPQAPSKPASFLSCGYTYSIFGTGTLYQVGRVATFYKGFCPSNVLWNTS
jgi:hypothetical protein